MDNSLRKEIERQIKLQARAIYGEPKGSTTKKYSQVPNEIHFEVIKFCQSKRTRCTCCNGCGSNLKKYSQPSKLYSKKFQETTDYQIRKLMSIGFSRDRAVMELLKEEA
ncbi:MAG: hypothetical protein Q8O30_06460 [Candidatus Omnitrophota bacterium]|nr:hypothetical protein [Candidatus Omnitrophota bacterium]